uniref:Reverse transcriptase domain-containing protein n=1 Tax=Leptobrachium leishanense TaxID=445787 RepID=A0A8C5M2S8_9ANUR
MPRPGPGAAVLVPVDLKLVSYNVRGLNKPEKRRRLLRDMASLHASIVFVQETHFCSTTPPSLRDRRFPLGYFDHAPESKSRGTAILISSSVPFVHSETYTAGDGRCVFVKGTIGGAVYTLANVYLPNVGQHRYLAKRLHILESFAEGTLILGGDFNIPMVPREDSSSARQRTPHRILAGIHRSLRALRLVDVWRALNPTVRDFTYYSSVHHTYTRLDYFFVPQFDLPLVRESTILATTWSDHAPVVLSLSSPLLRPRDTLWQLNESLLSDPGLVTRVDEALTNYFADHERTEVPLPTVWESHKAMIRGLLISLASRKKKEQRRELEALHSDIRRLERTHQESGLDDTYTELIQARTRLANALNPQLQRAILRTKCYFTLHEDKPGRLLARLLKQQRRRTYVPEIRTLTGKVTPDPNEIARSFREYYSALYNSVEDGGPPSMELIDNFLATRIPYRLTKEQGAPLSSPVTTEEVSVALKRQKNGKAPGPDGLPASYYKKFGDTLIPHMVQVFNALLTGQEFHTHSLSATMVVIPKEGKDPLSCASYRPISLLNSDIKLFASVLANRLHPLASLLVRRDQVGFIPGREARDGTIRTLNVLHLARHSETPTLLLSTDAEKAFDRVSWPFLFSTLRAMNLPVEFINWIAALYREPNARVRVNGVLSDSFRIQNGTRQGCPLSPLLFALSLEPLLESVRQNVKITGLEGTRETHKVSAYADDLIFYITNPLITLPEIVTEFQKYGALSNLKLNLEKSEVLNLTVQESTERHLRREHPFIWCNTKMRYLGIWLTKQTQDLYRENFLLLWEALRRDLAAWKPLKISWFGKISILKMNVLPRLLYLFQTIPVYIPPAYFTMVQSDCSKFVWNNSRLRISFQTMTRPKGRGGLAVPDFRLYYRATHLLRIVEWTGGGRHALWQDLELGATPHPTGVLPWMDPRRRSPQALKHPLVGATLRVWLAVIQRCSLSSYPSPLVPLERNPDFQVGVHPRLRRRLGGAPVVRALHFLSGPDLSPPWERDPQAAPPTILERFNYTQISHYLLSLPARHRLVRSHTPFEDLALNTRPISHGISCIYRLLQTTIGDTSPSFEHTWDEMIGSPITEDQWKDSYELAHRGSPQTRLQSNSYKVLALWYCTLALLFRIGLRLTPNCWRCDGASGSYLHVWWDCPGISPFWRQIKDTLMEVTSLDLPFTPGTFLLTHTTCSTESLRKSVALPMLMTARLLIARCWGQTATPSYRAWLTCMEEVRTLEDLMARVRDTMEGHLRKWFHWCSYVSSNVCRTRLS